MSRDKPWLKMWTEWLGDVNMDRLSLAEQGAWWRLYAYAHECGHVDENGKVDGGLVVAGIPLSLAEIMRSLKITDELDKAVFNQMVEKQMSAGFLEWRGDTLFISRYENEQRATTDTKEARRQRQADRRAALKAEEEKREPEKRTPPQDITKSIDERGERKEQHAQGSHENSVTHAQGTETGHEISVTAELSRCYERYIGLLNPVDADRIREFTVFYESHGGKIEWLEPGFKAAPVHKRRWPYVQAILERYIEEGGPDVRGRQGNEDEGRGADAAHRRGAETTARGAAGTNPKHKWNVKRSGPGSPAGGEGSR